MRNFILTVLFVLLAGCSWINTSDFDHFEYNDFIDVMTLAQQAKSLCAGSQDEIHTAATELQSAAHHLENYTLHRINNKSTLEIAKTIHATTAEMVERYATRGASSIYCETKLDNIVDQAKLGADAVQQKVRR